MKCRALVHAVHATLALAVSGLAFAQAADEFTVGDIRVEGLQRISEGTVYNYLPVNIGDRLDQRRVQEALRAMYATGFFRDVELRRDGSTLVVAVLERPSIESFEIKGNKDIKTEDLQKSLKNVGLAAGKTFDQSTLDEVKQYLTDQYFSRGKYAVKVDGQVEDVAGNKVKVTIDIKEGKRAKIREINIVGNTAFQSKDIVEQFKLKTPNWLSWYKQDDRYSREELSGDLEKLRSYYMDRGYADFRVDSTQVTIAPEKDDIFITMNITQGDVFKVGEVKLAGNMVVPEEDLRRLIFIKTGDTYSRKLITATTEAMVLRLGLDGYAFAKVDPVPQLDQEHHTVSLTLFVEPGNRAYVRHINISGATSINDEVLRREFRQLEGAYLSNAAVDRSKLELQRLPFIEKAETETKPVSGTPDLVDVELKIKEGLPGTFSAGIGYSGATQLTVNGSFTHSNFMGTGDRVQAEVQVGRFGKLYSFSHTDPYTNVDGVSRQIGLSYRDTTQLSSAASEFNTKQAAASLIYGYPISDHQRVSLGLSASYVDIVTSTGASAIQAIDWVQHNGNPYTLTTFAGTPPQAFFDYGTKYATLDLNAGWLYDTRNRALFADAGTRLRINGIYTLPVSEIGLYSVSADALHFIPVWRGLTLMFNANVSFAQALDGTTSVPQFRRALAGGPDTVRGFTESRLGPKDQFGRPYGGNLLTTLQTELLFPMPEKYRNSARVSLFYDIGNVFSTDNVRYVGLDLHTPVEYRFSYDNLKRSVGVAVQWLAPLGIFRFSYAIPLNAVRYDDGVHFNDETTGFQFSIGQAF